MCEQNNICVFCDHAGMRDDICGTYCVGGFWKKPDGTCDHYKEYQTGTAPARRTSQEELVKALRRMGKLTGGLMCVGCGHAHNCSIHGCAVVREAADKIKQLNNFTDSQCARLLIKNQKLQAAIPHWISVKDRLPENEEDVLIAYTRKGLRGDVYFCVGMAFHTDGRTNTEDSAYTWQTDYMDMSYDEEADAYIIPEGWWETVDFGEEFSAVDMPVTHWMPLPEPPEE